ncbi:Nuclear migration protein nudC (Nuclear distribution protein C homolog) [Durusdinium trenchii]|uniref:Nuclear migration protein nudC (Nuclear distribution protein C homolog) n=2 Tax=Durusdinium trenchii TaxID=1381693 RepID=A0ABP0QLF5_9DINO
MAEGSDERFDGVLLKSGSIDSILDAFFGFLQRKTDFFTGAQDEQAAEQMVLKYYKKHWKVGQKKRQEQQERNRAADEERKRKADEKKLKDEAEYRKRMEEAEKMKNVAQKKRKSQTKKLARSRLAKKRITKRQIMKIKRIKSLLHLAMGAPQTNTPGHRRLARWRSLFMCQYVPPGVKAKEIVCDIGGDTLKLGTSHNKETRL